ncbi:MAG: FAD-dependent oxidoreductase [Dehalococcoidia bacterium]|jgi:thioredoxin reductase (NADPH)|nr:FAD-dependent oxidoreductase [Dehalococcoidia bacterium]
MEERDVVIIGAGPAGLSAAIFPQLDGWSTLVLEGNWVGGQGAIAYTVANYPGFPPGDGALLTENMERQVTSAPPAGVGAELRHERVLSVNAEDLIVTTESNNYRAKAIILAMGSTMQRLGAPGEDRLVGKGVSYYAKRDCNQFSGKRVLVVGGGNTTAKSALVAKREASEVTLVHRRQSLRAYPAMTKRLQKEGIEIRYNTEVKEIKGHDKVEAVVLVNNKTAEEREIAIDWVVICVGTEPNTGLARDAGIDMANGFVNVDEQMMTSKPAVFACGEITGSHRQLITAASEGASAGMAVSEYLALEKVKKGEMFEGAKNGKYAEEYLAMLQG